MWVKSMIFSMLFLALLIERLFHLPLCLGCRAVQFLFFLSLFLKNIRSIRVALSFSFMIEIYMLFFSLTTESCGIDIHGMVAQTCGNDLRVGPLSILQWSLIITGMLFIQTFSKKKPLNP